MATGMHVPLSVSPVSRPGGSDLLTYGRYNDFALIDRPVGRA